MFKFRTSTIIAAIGLAVFLPSCGEDDVAVPTISGLEVGLGNSLTATIGSDLHIDGEIEAEGLIDRIEIDMHNEDGTGDDIEATFTNYSGQQNADFHEHIDIPSTTTEGKYHFHLRIVDQEGQTTEVERDVMVSFPASTAPVISDLEIGENDSHMADIGGELHLDAHIEAPELIDYIEIDMHNEDGTGDDIEATFTEYAGEDHADFHDHIEIPATATPGDYHFHMTVVDQAGQETEIDAEVTVQ